MRKILCDMQARIKGLVGPRHLVTFAEQKKFKALFKDVVYRRSLFPKF